MESQIRIAADNNRMVPIYYLYWEIQRSRLTSDKSDLQLTTLPFGLVA